MAALAVVPTPAPRHTLIEYLDDVATIEQTLESLADDETSDDARAELERMLADALQGTKAKIDRTCGILSAFTVAAAAAKAEAARCAARAKHFERQIDLIETRVLGIMAANRLTKLDGALSTLSSRKNPPAVAIAPEVLADPERIGWDYLRLPEQPAPVIDKALVKKALAAGVVIEGCELKSSVRLVRS